MEIQRSGIWNLNRTKGFVWAVETSTDRRRVRRVYFQDFRIFGQVGSTMRLMDHTDFHEPQTSMVEKLQRLRFLP